MAAAAATETAAAAAAAAAAYRCFVVAARTNASLSRSLNARLCPSLTLFFVRFV